MARRSGKAANRRARQRSAQRPPVRQPAPVPAAAPAADPEPTTSAPPPEPRRPVYVAGSSALGERGRTQYHYVARDLRNIAVLTVVMAVMLAVAYVAFNALGIV